MLGWKNGFRVVLLVVTAGLALSSFGQAKPRLTIEQLIDIKHPSLPIWSPDGQQVVFVWDRAGVSNIYLSRLDGGEPSALTSYSDGSIHKVFFGADGKVVYFARNGNLWKVGATGGEPTAAWSEPAGDGDYAPSPDRTRVAYTHTNAEGKGSDLVIRSLSGSSETNLANHEVSISDIAWSPNGLHICYIGGATTIPHDSSPAYSGAKLIYANPEYVRGVLYAVSTSGGNPTAIGTKGDYDAFSWSIPATSYLPTVESIQDSHNLRGRCKRREC